MRGFVSSLCLCAVIAILNLDVAVGSAVWKFGHETPDNYVVERQEGNLQFLQKSARIPLKVAACHEVTSVQVEVQNPIDTPRVVYDQKTRTVTIAYTEKQIGLSVYGILIKGRLIPGCIAYDGKAPIQVPKDVCINSKGKPLPGCIAMIAPSLAEA